MFTIFVGLILGVVIAAGCTIALQQKTLGIIGGTAIFIASILFSSFTVISAGHTGVQVTLGEVNPNPLTEGVHFVNPISSIKDVDVRLQRAELKAANAGTKDLQVVHTDIVVNFRLDPLKVPHIYKEYGLNVDEKVLGPGINEAFKSVTGHYTSEELVTKRDLVSTEILQHLMAKMAPFNITVSNISLVNFGFSEAYQKAIEAKVIATQQTAKAEQDLARIKVEAASRIAQAEGEAKAIAIQATAIQSNGGQNYVQLQAIEKWDGKLPVTMMGGSTVPFVNLNK
ncbi:HflC Membrane protease subunits, stomatin/prohibitin homologs [uncultured Caudovirales phage]|uniref:HflC Membrane protease subunits, stomatin/prohibitin homologs n=1 Tax=uncultured Caudovirales phage TaxID=2100421 RepID=A0A6J5TA37_9CAUD|nr:HflC Membrane protease subunits, stomatin/prohibitin homologs [uncultured Caudovirales phage]